MVEVVEVQRGRCVKPAASAGEVQQRWWRCGRVETTRSRCSTGGGGRRCRTRWPRGRRGCQEQAATRGVAHCAPAARERHGGGRLTARRPPRVDGRRERAHRPATPAGGAGGAPRRRRLLWRQGARRVLPRCRVFVGPVRARSQCCTPSSCAGRLVAAGGAEGVVAAEAGSGVAAPHRRRRQRRRRRQQRVLTETRPPPDNRHAQSVLSALASIVTPRRQQQ